MRACRFLSVAAVLLLAGCGGESGGRGAAQEKADPAIRSRAAEGEAVLKLVFALQQVYRAENGHWAATMDELREAGGQDPSGLRFYQPPRIVRARGEELCIVIEPTAAHASLWPQHVDQAGALKRGPCP